MLFGGSGFFIAGFSVSFAEGLAVVSLGFAYVSNGPASAFVRPLYGFASALAVQMPY